MECPIAEKLHPRTLPAKPNGRSFQMTLNEEKKKIGFASGVFLVNQITAKILFDFRAYHSFIPHEFGRKLNLSPHRLSTLIMVE